MKRYILFILIILSMVFNQSLDSLQTKFNNEVSNDSLANLINKKLSISSDSLATLIDNKVNEILDEVLYLDPLKGKVGGFEINPFLLLSSFSGEVVWLSGGYSRFDIDEHAEIAFPFSIMLGDSGEFSVIIDYQYRNFMGRNIPHKYRSGFYLLGGLRTALANDSEYDDSFNLGVAFGFGSRKFARTGWYWGWSIYAGKYLNSDRPLIDIEFFKFGKTF